jgi:hypothetical protein
MTLSSPRAATGARCFPLHDGGRASACWSTASAKDGERSRAAAHAQDGERRRPADRANERERRYRSEGLRFRPIKRTGALKWVEKHLCIRSTIAAVWSGIPKMSGIMSAQRNNEQTARAKAFRLSRGLIRASAVTYVRRGPAPCLRFPCPLRTEAPFSPCRA